MYALNVLFVRVLPAKCLWLLKTVLVTCFGIWYKFIHIQVLWCHMCETCRDKSFSYLLQGEHGSILQTLYGWNVGLRPNVWTAKVKPGFHERRKRSISASTRLLRHVKTGSTQTQACISASIAPFEFLLLLAISVFRNVSGIPLCFICTPGKLYLIPFPLCSLPS